MSGNHSRNKGIELPFPAKVLWPNGRTRNHQYRHAEFKKHKGWAQQLMQTSIPRCFKWNGEPIRLRYTITPKTAHPIDRDNCIAAMKAYQDGFALALCIDDQHFATPEIVFAEPEKPGRVVVEVLG